MIAPPNRTIPHAPKPRSAAVGLAAFVAVLTGSAAVSVAQVPENKELPVASARLIGDDVAIVRSASALPAARSAAADRLLNDPGPDARAAVIELLNVRASDADLADPARVEVAGLVLARIAAMPSAAPLLLNPIKACAPAPARDLAGRAADELTIAAIRAAGSIRTRESVEWLIEQARIGSPPGRSAAAFASLTRLTGHSEFGADANRWGLWFSQVRWISDAEWRRDLADSLARRADELNAQRAELLDRVVASARKGYLAVESMGDRSVQLAQFMNDDLAEVRLLGLSLARQELANARRLEPVAVDAVQKVLEDPVPAVRREAIELITILAPTDDQRQAEAAAAIARSLGRETDPLVAGALMRAAARWPDAALVPIALGWLESSQPAVFGPACGLLDAIRAVDFAAVSPSAGRLSAAVMRALDAEGAPGVDGAALRLLFAFGGERERSRALSLLGDAVPATRLAAAESLAQLEGAADAVTDAARNDPALFPAAAAAIARHRSTFAGFRTLAQLPCDSPDLRRDRLLALSRQLSHADLYRAANGTADANLREAMLARLLSEPLSAQFAINTRRTMRPGVVAGLLLLYGTRVELGRPAGALAAIEALSPTLDRDNNHELDDQRTEMLLWLNRLDEAGHLRGSIEAWLNGLQHCIGLPHARAALAALEARFGPNISGPEAERLAALRMAIEATPEFYGPPAPPADAPVPEPK
ncbi:MAG: hypothetical protein IT438_13240 [Phycisphaerales bacterium]|nr:hypothetical protein [Phycisphaerales bacterium]